MSCLWVIAVIALFANGHPGWGAAVLLLGLMAGNTHDD